MHKQVGANQRYSNLYNCWNNYCALILRRLTFANQPYLEQIKNFEILVSKESLLATLSNAT